VPRPSEGEKPVLLVHFGDLHVGSSVALSPPRFPLPDGGVYLASELQLWYWKMWREFWRDTAALKAAHGARCVAVSGGDERDGDHHGTTQLVTADEEYQDHAVLKTLEVAEPVVDEWHFVRGTPAHEGPGSGATERYARGLAAKGWNVVPRSDREWSHWAYTGNHEGVRVEAAHAPGTKSWVPTTRGASCARHAQYTKAEYHESGVEPPDLVVRHHVHYWQGPGCDGGTCCFFVPGWQAASNWVKSRGVKSATESHFVPGGLRVLCRGGDWKHFWWLRKPRSGVAWARS
jgi:hypothetical protein